MKSKKQKAAIAAVAIPVITAGTVAIGAAYQNGNRFEPSDTDQQMQKNQIVFSDDQNLGGEDEKKNKDNSELVQKDQNSQDQTGKNQQDAADYLFQQGLQNGQNNAGRVMIANGAAGSLAADGSSGAAAAGDNIYNITGDGSGSNFVIGGYVPSDVISEGQTGTAGNEKQNNSGNSASDSNKNTENDNQGSDTKLEPDNGNSTTPRPSASAKDPDSEKILPSTDDGIINKRFEEDDSLTDTEGRVIILPGYEYRTGYSLYKGQSSVDRKMIYNSLYTFVWGDDGVRYVWDSDALGKYIRIDRVSFDGGQTWITDFPLTIPNDTMTSDMLIEVSYRLLMSSSWTTREVSYPLKESRVFVLSKEIEKADSVIDKDTILNYDQYPDPGKMVNLFYYQYAYLGEDRITELFPGWEENGELVPWYYNATVGRHILEPAKKVPLSDDYIVKIKSQWMSDDYQVGFEYSNLSYLQTLTDFRSTAIHNFQGNGFWDWLLYNELEVPKYVQAVVLDDSEETRSVDYLKLPDTVLYVEDTGSSLHVNYGYIVDENNPNYIASEDGLLWNKAKTEIAAVPYRRTSLTVQDSVEKVQISTDNQLEEITLEADTLDKMPALTYKNLKNCKIIVKDDLLESFLIENYAKVALGEGNCVAASSDPDVTYTITNRMIINNEGEVCKVLSNGSTTLALPDTAGQINKDALKDVPEIDTLILPKNGRVVTLEQGCLEGSSISSIQCYSKKQYDAVESELEMSGTEYEIAVELVGTSKEGYSYSVTEEDGIQTVTLLDVPTDLVSFDGTLTADDGTLLDITEIADRAFADSKKLQWVDLPYSVTQIGYQAFQNCTSLEGVLIRTEFLITIGDEAFDGCESLRFVASNAFYGIMENDYDPIVTDERGQAISYYYFFVPTGAYGYTEHCISFSEESGVSGYDMVDIGGEGKMLCGTDTMGQPWLGLRSGSKVADEVTLPVTTKELFYYAMADTTSPSGSYSVNWEALPDTQYLDTGCFQNSDLGGTVTFGNDYTLGDYALADCSEITDVVMPGEDVALSDAAFRNCTSLKSVEFGGFSIYSGLPLDVFDGCDALRDLTFRSEAAPTLQLYGSVGYRFNYNWTEEEEAENLHIHIPEGTAINYIKKWRYAMCGYISYDSDTAYNQMRNDLLWDNINWDTWEFPTDEEIDLLVEEKLLTVENRIRTMLGEKAVSEPSELYQYRESAGFTTLVRVPTYLKDLRLDSDTLDLPTHWYLDYIGANAFSRAKNLQKVTIQESLAGIYANAFAGVESDTVTLVFEGALPTNLLTDTEGEDFSFGVDDSHVKLIIPEGAEAAYRKLWQYQLAGYCNEAAMRQAITEQLTDSETGIEPTEEAVNAAMEQRLQETAKRLDLLFGDTGTETEEEQQP